MIPERVVTVDEQPPSPQELVTPGVRYFGTSFRIPRGAYERGAAVHWQVRLLEIQQTRRDGRNVWAPDPRHAIFRIDTVDAATGDVLVLLRVPFTPAPGYSSSIAQPSDGGTDDDDE